MDNVSAQGFGPENPVASNSTPQGRQLNRRVDLVVNGESIAAQTSPAEQNGTTNGTPAMAAPPASDQQQSTTPATGSGQR